MNKYIAMFLITVIKANKYRFGYGRKWTIEKMKETVIKLPASRTAVLIFNTWSIISNRSLTATKFRKE